MQTLFGFIISAIVWIALMTGLPVGTIYLSELISDFTNINQVLVWFVVVVIVVTPITRWVDNH